nr:unnamed protein product [Spirometra erinaceieuropaei]
MKCPERDPHGSLRGVEGGGSWCARCEFLQLKAQGLSTGTVAVLKKGTSVDKDDDSSLASEPLLGHLNQSSSSLEPSKSLSTDSSAHPSAESFHDWKISPRPTPSYFYVDVVLRGLHFIYANIDDLLVASSVATEHEIHLRQVFERLNSFGVVIDAAKWEFGVPSVLFLGHEVNSDGIKPVPVNVSAIATFPVSTTINQLRRFLAMPLNSPLAYDKKTLVMTEDAVKSFNDVKAALAIATLLAHPRADAPLTLMTDASNTAVGASLQQTVSGVLQPLAFFSKKLSPAETRYSVFGRELLAVYLSIRHFRHFLEGREFVVLTDQKPLVFALMTSPDRYSPCEIRHLNFISQFPCDT